MKKMMILIIIAVAAVFISNEVAAKGYNYKKAKRKNHKCMAYLEYSFGPTFVASYDAINGYGVGFGMRYLHVETDIIFHFDGDLTTNLKAVVPVKTPKFSLLAGVTGGIYNMTDDSQELEYDVVPMFGLRLLPKIGGRISVSPYVAPTDWDFKEMYFGATLSFNFY